MSTIKIKRVYENVTKDEYRVLVDRLWPRGVTKEQAAIDLWLKEIAPSPELRKWFNHDPEKFNEFRNRYIAELERNPATATFLNLLAKHKTLTLVYAAKNEDVNHAAVLKGFMESM